jgi:hypothetical protein
MLMILRTREVMNQKVSGKSSKPDYNEIGEWANSLPALIREDSRRFGNLMRKMTSQTPTCKYLDISCVDFGKLNSTKMVVWF